MSQGWVETSRHVPVLTLELSHETRRSVFKCVIGKEEPLQQRLPLNLPVPTSSGPSQFL